ncbi:MAG TPA: hypothetical protein VK484_09145 [Ferruginibacter sp.]|nr:hypothetical protein [Ferruginibacter sp.]
MKKPLLFISCVLLTAAMISCTKQDSLSPQPIPVTKLLYLDFLQDTLPVKLSITMARSESIGNLTATSVEGKLPDSIVRKNNLIIRVTGDSARAYTYTEIFASYTDSSGNTYSTNITDTINKVSITKLEKRRDGSVEGNFTIRVSNFTKTKTLSLKEGKFSTLFFE